MASDYAQNRVTQSALLKPSIIFARNSDKERRILFRSLFVIHPFKRKRGCIRCAEPQNLKLIEGRHGSIYQSPFGLGGLLDRMFMLPAVSRPLSFTFVRR